MRGLCAVPLLVMVGCSFERNPAHQEQGAGPGTEAGPDPDAPPDPLVDAPRDADRACIGYTMVGTGLYSVSNSTASWDAAEEACVATNGHLVVLETDAENTTVRTLIPTTTRFWIGSSDLGTEGTWLWVTGGAVPLDQMFWDGGQPNDSGGVEECGEMSTSGEWNDKICTAAQLYVCECDGIPVM